MEKITLQELIDALSDAAGITKKEAEDLLDLFPGLITEGLINEGEAKVRGLGTFKLKRIAARMGRNLQTGEKMEIPEHSRVTFTPEKELREYVNRDYKYLTYTELGEKKPGKAEPEKEIPPPSEKKLAPPPEKEPSRAIPPAEEKKPVPPPEKKAPLPPPPSRPAGEAKKYKEKSGISPYWLIPLVLFIIAVLLVIFYLRACRTSPPPEETRPMPQEQPVIGPAATDDGEDTLEVAPVPETAPEEQQPAPPTEVEGTSAISPEGGRDFDEPFEYTIERGEYLYQLGGKFYGDSLLWVLIYRENREILGDPEEVITGRVLTIPPLEGTAGNLSQDDSTRIADGYRILYEYYGAREDPRTTNFWWGMINYRP